MRKPSTPLQTAPKAGRALTAREAAFGRPAAATRMPTPRKSTLHTAGATRRPAKDAAAERDVAETARRPQLPLGGTGTRTAPTAAQGKSGHVAETAVVVPKVVPRVVGDQRVVVGLVLGFFGCVVLLLSVNVSGNMRSERSRTEMTETFRSVHAQQQMFRMLNSRFATWPELKASGASLPVSESVRASKADASHWFLSLVDSRTNMICDRTGELWDESPDERIPVCRTPSP